MPLLTHLDIVNAGCAVYGDDPVEGLDEDVGNGQAAGLVYETILDFNLGQYPSGFSWAKELRQLSRDDGLKPLSGFTYVYDLPVEDVIGTPVYITDDPTDAGRRFSEYALIDGQVHSSATSLCAMVKFRPDPHRWSGTFRAAHIHALAASLALSRASDRALSELLQVKAYGTTSEMFRGGMMGAAIREDSFSTPARKAGWDNNVFTRARSGS